MKLKLPSPGIIPFIIANVLAALGYYVSLFFLVAIGGIALFIGLLANNPEYTAIIAILMITGFFTVIFCVVYLILKNFFIYLALKKIEKKGKEKYKNFVQNLKKDYKKQFLIILFSVLIDAIIIYFHFADNYYTPTGTYKLATAKRIYIAQLEFYLLGGSLTIGYLVTFVIWKIQDMVKKKS